MTKIYPLMPLRDIVIFPHMVAPLVVGREKSIRALEDAMEKKTEIFLVTQLEPTCEDPNEGEIYQCGTLSTVMQLLRLPDGTIKALVEGQRRARIVSRVPHEEFMQVEVEECTEVLPGQDELIAYERELRKAFQQFAHLGKKIGEEVVVSCSSIEDPVKLANVICSHLPLSSKEKQEVLEVETLGGRIELLLEILFRELQLAEVERKINIKVKQKLSRAQRDYYLGEKIREMQKEIGQGEDGVDEMTELENIIKAKKMPAYARARVQKELKKLRGMPAMSAETTVVRSYIDTILGLPWKKRSKGQLNVLKAEGILNKDHYGLEKPKERILEFLAVQSQVAKLKGPILCFVGPPGVGKTSICQSIAKSMGREFARLSLGGLRDEAEIRGHRRTYVGAMAGKVLRAMQKVGVANPVFCLDEIDKMSTDFRGDPAAALLEVLDPEQNSSFNDHYLDLDYDLSQVFFITTANSLEGIPIPLQDRMEIIQLSGYTEEDKQVIAEKYLLPKQLKANGFQKDDIFLSPGAMLTVVRHYTREAGVRGLERVLASLCRKVARDRLQKGKKSKKYRIGEKSVPTYLGTPKYRYGLAEERDEVGLATGLAWTQVGGVLLQIEVILMPGKGKLTLTGQLGDVMQESAQAAYSYIRSRAKELKLEPDFYEKVDIHVHVPEGAIPKDGPSAGITIATTLASALTGRPIRHELAMTGEITLRGRVLPIGGLTEKLLAAKRGNITKVLLPEENGRDLKDVPAKIKNALDIKLVSHMDQVLEQALLSKGKNK
ncbi:endopeptidase La [Desulfotalea psychrophila]|uniref:Lon protease 2 n=1 Tax=Desulfotalea psychrophila (strain LSv54 / DSM 12343) TaxID=177439 RepID=LON2_DESPS|nr:endopeptidase La [Desulfotalea psychrophila]Q6AK61.1 RecName: Full=Lon protease 2; AltName: Full=ATP-dependent protease La 2 [Desulfotalea psychrophila LSv54]CAG37265.1 probable ATP-dependent protease La [Desulfotalea psychrophila LSv54]